MSRNGDLMATVGYVHISITPKTEHEVYNALLKIEEIVDLTPIFGDCDFIAKIEADDINKLGQVVLDKIRTISGVIETKTWTGAVI